MKREPSSVGLVAVGGRSEHAPALLVTGAGEGRDPAPPVDRFGWRCRVAIVLLPLVITAVFIGLLTRPALPAPTFWGFQNTSELVRWLVELVSGVLVEAGGFAAVGLLTALALPRPRALRARLLRYLLCIVLVAAIAGALHLVRRDALLAPLPLMTATLCGLFGAWIGVQVARGRKPARWMLRQLLAALLVIGAGALALVHFALVDERLPFDVAPIRSEDKRRLVRQLRSGHYHPKFGVHARRLLLAQDDVDRLLTWGLSIGDVPRRARVRFDRRRFDLQASFDVPFLTSRYANVTVAGEGEVVRGVLDVELDELRIGAVPLPGFLRSQLVAWIIATIQEDADARDVLASIKLLRPQQGAVELVYGRGQFGSRTLPNLLARLGAHPDLLTATRAHVRHLVDAGREVPWGSQRFVHFVHAAFSEAERRSKTSRPELENRAAIYALAILLGHHRVEFLVGPVLDRELRREAKRYTSRVRLRGRNDWTRHYWISAAIALLSSEAASDAVGLLKEELDARIGGSGFSFSDLMADRAGTMLARAATRDEASARAMQRRLSGKFTVDALFPPANDLPEGITARELRTMYGGVGGPLYRATEAIIERRLAKCAALR